MSQSIKKKILVVGSLAFDSVQTPAGQAEKLLGGAANYFSIAASFFIPVEVIGIVGEDFPEDHLDWLSHRSIGIQGIQRVQGKTFHWVGSYLDSLNEAKTLSTFLNVFESFQPQLSEVHQKIPYVFLGNIDPQLQLKVLEQVKEAQWVGCDSMNFWITGKLNDLREVLQHVDLLSINEAEALMLSQEKNLLVAAEKIRKMGPSILVIKRGEYGAMLFTEHSIFMVPAFPLKNVVDPTGAGDSFAGALMGYLASQGISRSQVQSHLADWEMHLRKALVWGCVMASFTVEDFSFRRLMSLDFSELSKRKVDLMNMLRVDSL